MRVCFWNNNVLVITNNLNFVTFRLIINFKLDKIFSKFPSVYRWPAINIPGAHSLSRSRKPKPYGHSFFLNDQRDIEQTLQYRNFYRRLFLSYSKSITRIFLEESISWWTPEPWLADLLTICAVFTGLDADFDFDFLRTPHSKTLWRSINLPWVFYDLNLYVKLVHVILSSVLLLTLLLSYQS